jgi:glutamine---fructose-6-phosphate transaminase (isomerizing)
MKGPGNEPRIWLGAGPLRSRALNGVTRGEQGAPLTELERAIRSQPEQLARLGASDVAQAAARLRGRRRVWLVGTGSSQHVAELGALLLAEAGLDARWSGSYEFARGPLRSDRDDAVILISHTARTSFALAARAAALDSGAEVLSITGIGAGWPEALETVALEQSETYTVSVTAALMVLLRIARELGAPGLSRERTAVAVDRVHTIIARSAAPELGPPERAIILVGNGPGAVSAREGALKLREAAGVLAEGYGGEYLLHGHAVPLRPEDAMVLVDPAADPDGLVAALGDAAEAQGLVVASVDEPSIEHPILAQLAIIVRLQLLALRFSEVRSTDPDKAIVGRWANETTWAIGRPGAA